MHEVIAPVGEDLDDRRQARHADLQARVERDVDLRDRAQPAVDVRVGADDLHLEARHAALAQLVERVRDAVHPADRVGDERDAQRLAVAVGELALLAAEERRGGRVGDRRQAGVEERRRCGSDVPAAGCRRGDLLDRLRELALMAAPGATEEVGVREVLVLEQRQQLGLGEVELDRGHPGAQQGARVLGDEAGVGRAGAGVALLHEPLDHLEDVAGIRSDRPVAGAVTQRARGEAHRGVRPLRGAALLAAWAGAAEHDVVEERTPRPRVRGLGERPADVDARVVVGAADARAAVRLDVDDGGRVQLPGAGAVARLPDREELREPAAVAR